MNGLSRGIHVLQALASDEALASNVTGVFGVSTTGGFGVWTAVLAIEFSFR